MQITKRQLGLAIGVAIVALITLLAGYLPVAWVMWDWNPANWPQVARTASVAIVVAIGGLRWAILRVKIVEGNDNED